MGFLEEVALDLRLKGRKDWGGRDGGGILQVTRDWEHTGLPLGQKRVWKDKLQPTLHGFQVQKEESD